MRIIAVTGNSSIGKTTTLNLVYDMLISRGGISTHKMVIGNPSQNDFSDIVIWKGKKIAFFTMGDYSKEIIIAIRHNASILSDELICACNTKFVRPFAEIAKHPNVLVPKIAQPNIALRTMDNQTMANHIFSHL